MKVRQTPTGAPLRESVLSQFRGKPYKVRAEVWTALPSGWLCQPRAGRVDLRAPAKQVGRAYPVTKLSPDTAMSKAIPKETREAAAKPLLKFVGEADTATFLFSLFSLNCGESRNNLPSLQPKSPPIFVIVYENAIKRRSSLDILTKLV